MNPQSVILIKRFLLLLILCLVSTFSLKGILALALAQKPEREVEDKIPKHVPIKVKIRSEKEKGFKDLENRKWLRDLKLEVTNTSDKPIYFLELWIVLPEVITENGMELGFPLRFGRADFIKFNTLALPEDIPIQPGDRYIYKIADNYQRGWEARWPRETRPDPKKIRVKFVQLSFGDGTGFKRSDAKPYPYQRERSRSAPCRESPNLVNDKEARLNLRAPFPELLPDYSLLPAPAGVPAG